MAIRENRLLHCICRLMALSGGSQGRVYVSFWGSSGSAWTDGLGCLRRECRVGPGELHPEPLTDPDLTLSRHPARATARRLPPSVENWRLLLLPVGSLPTAMTCLLRSTSITPASSLLQGSPPLSGASVLSASRLEPLAPFPLPSPARFSRSVPEPD